MSIGVNMKVGRGVPPEWYWASISTRYGGSMVETTLTARRWDIGGSIEVMAIGKTHDAAMQKAIKAAVASIHARENMRSGASIQDAIKALRAAGRENDGKLRAMADTVHKVPIQPQKHEGTSAVDHPQHYGGDTVYETIKVLKAWLPREEYIGFLRGNAIKYLSRLGKKGEAAEDAEKAAWYQKALADELKAEPYVVSVPLRKVSGPGILGRRSGGRRDTWDVMHTRGGARKIYPNEEAWRAAPLPKPVGDGWVAVGEPVLSTSVDGDPAYTYLIQQWKKKRDL